MKIKFKNIPNSEKPRERFIKYGVECLSNEELISIILKTGTKENSVNEISLNILSKVNDISELKNMKINTLKKIDGIGEVKAIELLSAIELGHRIYKDDVIIKKYNINNPIDIFNYYKKIYQNKNQEEFYVIYLDTKNNVISHKLLFIGTLNKSIVHPREIFKEAYIYSSAKIICIHNHPSGDPNPSKEDIEITRKINEIALIHDIKLLDHIIIGKYKYYSFFENKKILNK